MNRALSIRSGKASGGQSSPGRKAFSFGSLRGAVQPDLARKLYNVIKSQNKVIASHEAAGKDRHQVATQLSDWGEQSNDESVSDISDKIGVLLAEMGVLEDNFAHNLEDARGVLKHIRNTEKSVQPSRDGKAKIADDIGKTKLKEPESTKLVVLEQELVRAEAENLVAEAQLNNITRSKLKEAYAAEFAAVREYAEKQLILAQHGERLLSLLDDTPITPGDGPRPYEQARAARQILDDAEEDLRTWQPTNGEELEDVNVQNTGEPTIADSTQRGNASAAEPSTVAEPTSEPVAVAKAE